MSDEEEFKANVQDIFFDYDTYDIRTDAAGCALRQDASFLVSHPDLKIVIGGYCDERGSDEYNLALGQNRADAAKNALVTAGVAARPHPRDQLRQGEALLLRVHRRVLAAEPPRRLHHRPVELNDGSDADCHSERTGPRAFHSGVVVAESAFRRIAQQRKPVMERCMLQVSH